MYTYKDLHNIYNIIYLHKTNHIYVYTVCKILRLKKQLYTYNFNFLRLIRIAMYIYICIVMYVYIYINLYVRDKISTKRKTEVAKKNN
jgi:hypothetical protein